MEFERRGTLRGRLDFQRTLRMADPERPSFKANLFVGYEVPALADALGRCGEEVKKRLDCVMVADSYAMTHLGFSVTRTDSDAARELYFRVLRDLVYDVRLALDATFDASAMPWLLADMPAGSYETPDIALRCASDMLGFGAMAVKLECGSDAIVDVVDALSAEDIPVLAHVGYTPQSGGRKSHGIALDGVKTIARQVRSVRDAGAMGVVVEGLSTIVNEQLCRPHPKGLPIYSIFSGPAKYGGQSVNIWDAVFRPGFPARFFPETAQYGYDAYPRMYTRAVIAEHMAQLLKDVWDGRYPHVRDHGMSDDEVREVVEHEYW